MMQLLSYPYLFEDVKCILLLEKNLSVVLPVLYGKLFIFIFIFVIIFFLGDIW